MSNIEDASVLQLRATTAYLNWLATGGEILGCIDIDASPKEAKKFARSYRQAGASLMRSIESVTSIDAMKVYDDARLLRARDLFVRRFPKLIDVLGGKSEAVTHNFVDYGAGFSDRYTNVFIEQVDCEQDVLRQCADYRLKKVDEICEHAGSKYRLQELRRYWQPRTLDSWLKYDQHNILDKDLLNLARLAIYPAERFEIDSLYDAGLVTKGSAASYDEPNLELVHSEPLPLHDDLLPPQSAGGVLAS